MGNEGRELGLSKEVIPLRTAGEGVGPEFDSGPVENNLNMVSSGVSSPRIEVLPEANCHNKTFDNSVGKELVLQGENIEPLLVKQSEGLVEGVQMVEVFKEKESLGGEVREWGVDSNELDSFNLEILIRKGGIS